MATKLESPSRSLAATADLFKLLCDPVRLRILVHLRDEGPTCVGDLCQVLGQNQSALSHHLALLRLGGLIECERKGKRNYYAICPSSPAGAILEAVA